MESSTKTKNYYEILEVPSNATPEQIHEGYIRAKNAYSQDSLALYSLMSKDECDSVLSMIEEAYSIVSDPSKRAQYDSARGITSTYEAPTYQAEQMRQEKQADRSNENKITKIVASNKYSLSFTANPEFDQEIEQTTEFTGEFLKKVREYKNVDIPRMAEMTKVSKTYLRNIEEENWENLPALVYVRGFVYQYAKCLKLNPDLVATSYLYRLKKLKGEN